MNIYTVRYITATKICAKKVRTLEEIIIFI